MAPAVDDSFALPLELIEGSPAFGRLSLEGLSAALKKLWPGAEGPESVGSLDRPIVGLDGAVESLAFLILKCQHQIIN
jgi:hypothetical protein